MTYQEILESIRFHSGNLSRNDLEQPWMNQDINRVYRKLGAMYDWNGLIVRDEEFTTTDGTSTYYLPLPLVRIIGSRVVYDTESTTTGPCTLIIGDTEIAQFWTSATNQSLVSPRVGLVIGGSGTVKKTTFLDNSTDNGSATIPFNSITNVAVGDWFTIGPDASLNTPGDFAYRITAVDTGGSFVTLQYAYRGPRISTGSSTTSIITVRPGNTKRLQFFPGFTEYGKIVSYDWVTQPQMLWNLADTPEVPELSDAIIFTVLAENFQYHNPADLQGSMMKMAHYQGLAKQALKEARQNAAQGI